MEPIQGSVAVDTNVLLRLVVGDAPVQAQIARDALQDAEALIAPVPVLCEIAWVLQKVYRFDRVALYDAMAALVSQPLLVTDRQAAAMGLETLKAGGDFADGAIAAQGIAMGGATFVSFDRLAVTLVSRAGLPARHLA